MNKISTTDSQVVLPMSAKQFRSFMEGLLGKPQTITKNFRGHFSIDKDDIINIDKLLEQRVNQQNEGGGIHFTAAIYYSNNSTTELNSIANLIDYNETLPLICEAIHITWKFLIHFKDKESPEMQEVNLSFITNRDIPKRYDFEEDSHNLYFMSNSISLRIKHTARTWGADIEGILSKHLESIITVSKFSFTKLLKYDLDDFNKLLFASIILFSTLYGYINLNNNESFQLNDGINTLLFITSIFCIVYIVSFIGKILRINIRDKPGYILLNKKSISDKEIQEKKYKQSWYYVTAYIVSQLALGIFGNLIFQKMF